MTHDLFAGSIDSSTFARPVACVGLCCSDGCLAVPHRKSRLQKSKGYYQEGIASLDHDQQKAFVSFQKAVKLNPTTRKHDYGLGHILCAAGKIAAGRGRIPGRDQN